MRSRISAAAAALAVLLAFPGGSVAAGHSSDRYQRAYERLEQRMAAQRVLARASAGPTSAVTDNFRILGHLDPSGRATTGDVWVHGDTAYLGTWSDPCIGQGVIVIDVSDPANPVEVARVAQRSGTSAEDVVVRHVDTKAFTGDLLAAGIQRCGDAPALDTKKFGVSLWDVTDPSAPTKLGAIGLTNGGGGVHELDIAVRKDGVFVLAATPGSEAFDPVPGGEFRIVDVTDPRHPAQVGEWGAIDHGLARGPFDGIGSFGAAFDHSARASASGMRAFVSYWDLGVLTFNISDPTNPRLVDRTRYPREADGDAHSVAPYRRGRFLLQNDEDFDPKSPSRILYSGGAGIASEQPGAPALWASPDHRIHAPVVKAAKHGCKAADYPANTTGNIAVVRTPFPFFDSGPGQEPLCTQDVQELAAEQAGAIAVVHDFISDATSPQVFDFGEPGIPALFTDHRTAQGMVDAGSATLVAQRPSWGFLRVFDARSGREVARFDALPYVHDLVAPAGFWSIHNTEVAGRHAYSSWYTHGVVALDLSPLGRDNPRDPQLVGQFVPPGGDSNTEHIPDGVTAVWGVALQGGLVYASDTSSGLWIVEPTGPAG